MLKIIEEFDLRSDDLRKGLSYRVSDARSPGTLARKAAGPDGATFTVTMEIDPDAVRRARAEADVAVGEVMQEPMTLEAALLERSKETVSGTILVTFDTDSAGNLRRRTKVTTRETKRPDGSSEREVVTETVERSSAR